MSGGNKSELATINCYEQLLTDSLSTTELAETVATIYGRGSCNDLKLSYFVLDQLIYLTALNSINSLGGDSEVCELVDFDGEPLVDFDSEPLLCI